MVITKLNFNLLTLLDIDIFNSENLYCFTTLFKPLKIYTNLDSLTNLKELDKLGGVYTFICLKNKNNSIKVLVKINIKDLKNMSKE